MEEIKPGYTRVTEILRPWNDFSGIPEEILEHKRLLGSAVHEAIHKYNECIPVLGNFEGQEYFDSFLLWVQEFHLIVISSEVRLYDDYLKITGCVDAVVRFPHEDALVLVDWKTSASYTKKISCSWELQGTFYHYLVSKNGGDNLADRFLFVQLSPNGELPKVREFTFRPQTMAICAAAVEVYRFFNPS